MYLNLVLKIFRLYIQHNILENKKHFLFEHSEHGISVEPQDMAKLSDMADPDGEVSKDEFLNFAKHSEFFKNQLGLL